MALEDILFIEGDGQDFIVEIDPANYTGTLSDITIEQSSDSDTIEIDIKVRPFVNNIIRVR